MLLMVQFASAQQSLYVISKSGGLTVYPAKKVSFANAFFNFAYGDLSEITRESFLSSFTVSFKSQEYKSLSVTAEFGICFSDINSSPTIYDGMLKLGSSLKNYTYGIYGLDGGTTYYYRAYAKINDAVCYGEVQQVTTFGKKPAQVKSSVAITPTANQRFYRHDRGRMECLTLHAVVP